MNDWIVKASVVYETGVNSQAATKTVGVLMNHDTLTKYSNDKKASAALIRGYFPETIEIREENIHFDSTNGACPCYEFKVIQGYCRQKFADEIAAEQQQLRAPKSKGTHEPKLRKKSSLPWWAKLLLFPFRLVWWIIKGIWSML